MTGAIVAHVEASLKLMQAVEWWHSCDESLTGFHERCLEVIDDAIVRIAWESPGGPFDFGKSLRPVNKIEI